MPVVDLAALTAPVLDDAPCGADLDAAGDPDFMNFMARAEGLLPASYFSGPNGLPFDRMQIDLPAELAAAAPFLGQTRDVRLLVMLAKFAILTRSADDFVACIQATAALLETRWEEVHPRAEGGDFTSRVAALETLDDNAPIVIPLQYLPLVQSRRSGPITFRHVMFASGEVQAREGEEAHDRATIDKALAEAELDALIARREQIDSLRSAFHSIEKSCAGAGQFVKLAKVTTLVGNIFQLLNNAIAERDPASAMAIEATTQAASAEAEARSAPGLRIHSKEAAAAALAAVEIYFCRAEPSNPALLLVRQAQQLTGKSFLDAMQVLIPARVAEAKLWIGKDRLIELPLESLASFATVEAAPYSGESAAENNPGDPDGGQEGSPEALGPPTTRAAAFGLLEQIAVYYRAAEPSSPVAAIIDRARGFADRDFLTLLKDLLPISSSE